MHGSSLRATVLHVGVQKQSRIIQSQSSLFEVHKGTLKTSVSPLKFYT